MNTLTDLQNQAFGQLLLSPDGIIVAAPQFFLQALEAEIDDDIFSLFDIERNPRLNFIRFESRSPSLIEYHVVVESNLFDPYSFRYWYSHDTADGNSLFSIIDDTAIHRYEEWRFHQLRTLVTHDVQNVVISEFRNQFTTLSVLTEALDDAGDDLSEVCEKLRNLSMRLDATLNGLDQDFRDDEEHASTSAPVEVKDLIRTIPSWSKGQATIEVNVDLGAASKIINDSFLGNVLLPVVTNAVEASQDDGGKVFVDIQLSDSLPGSIIVTIKDNGVGMDINVLSRAEDPFFTTKEGHVGLGLSYVRQFIDKQGGRMSLRSSSSGTTATIGIPILPKND